MRKSQERRLWAGLIESVGLDWFSLAERVVSILVEGTSEEKAKSPEEERPEKLESD